MVQTILAKFDGGVIVPAEPLALPPGQQLRVEIETIEVSASRGLPTGAGKYHSGRNDIAERAEDLLRQAVEEGKWP
jgi:predicted DNA-binding antitoxin AbrB/MazE fold protein